MEEREEEPSKTPGHGRVTWLVTLSRLHCAHPSPFGRSLTLAWAPSTRGTHSIFPQRPKYPDSTFPTAGARKALPLRFQGNT